MILAYSAAYSQKADYKFDRVVIDAGHGGKDPGATFGGIFEKDIVLDVALKTGDLIKKRYPEVKVIYTRDKDIYLSPFERPVIANKQNADMFISIHVNSSKKQEVTGAETYFLGMHKTQENLEVAKKENSVILLDDDYSTKYEGFDPNSAESYIIFELMQNEYLDQSRTFAEKVQKHIISNTGRHDRGVRQAGFIVLKALAMPSVLIELGFLSNKGERNYLIAEDSKNLMAQSIFNAFCEYKQRFDDRNSAAEKPKDKKEDSKKVKTDGTNKDTVKKEVKKETIESKSDNKSDSVKIVVSDTTIIDVDKLEGKWFGVQIMASKDRYLSSDPIFQNKDSIYYLYENGFHKYFSGLSKNSNTTLNSNSKLREIFTGAFPVAFINGKKVPFSEAK